MANAELPEGFKMTELGPLPEGWEVVRLGVLLTPLQSKIPRNMYDGSIPILYRIPFASGVIELRPKRETRTDLIEVLPDSLVVSKINLHQGAVAINRGPKIVCTTHYSVYSVSDSVDIEWLWRFLRTDSFQLLVGEIKHRGFKKEANYKFIKELPIPLPPLPEQRAIADTLRTVDRKIQAEERRKAALDALFKTLLHHLMTGKVRVPPVGAGVGVNVGADVGAGVGGNANVGAGSEPTPTEPAPTENGDTGVKR